MNPICTEGRIPNLATAPEYIAAISEAGFRAADSQDLTSQVKRTWSIVIRRFAERMLQQKRYRSFLFDRKIRNRIFAFTAGLILLRYQVTVMRVRTLRCC